MVLQVNRQVDISVQIEPSITFNSSSFNMYLTHVGY